MASEHKLVKIISPSEEVYDTFEKYKKIIKSVLPDANILLVGSFAIPMRGKEEFDILIETSDIEETREILVTKGFSKGPIIGEEGFMHCRLYPIMCDARIVKHDSKLIQQYLKLIKRLQENNPLRKEYEELKESNHLTVKRQKSMNRLKRNS